MLQRRRFLGRLLLGGALASGGCLGSGSDDGTVESFRVVVEYGGPWQGSVRFLDDDTMVRTALRGTATDRDRKEYDLPDDLRDHSDLEAVGTPINVSATPSDGEQPAAEDNPLTLALHVEGGQVGTDRSTSSDEAAEVTYEA
jgi:hypothetical protein